MTDGITSGFVHPLSPDPDVEGGSQSLVEHDDSGASSRGSANRRGLYNRHGRRSDEYSLIRMNNSDRKNSSGRLGDTAAGGDEEHVIWFLESSNKLWRLYLTLAQQEDDEQSVNWAGDAEGILVFTGVFSGTVASFLLSGYNDLFPDEFGRVTIILAQISRQLAAISNGTTFPISPTFDSFTFYPRRSSIVVNVLWAISLAFSLTAALLATLMHQWTRRYNQVSRRSHGGARAQALLRAYFANGTKEHYMSFTVALLPAIVHLSVVLFFIGFAIFLFVANQTVSYYLIATLGLCTVAYLILTFSSFRSHDSPYQTPLTLPLWVFIHVVKLFLAWLFGCWRKNFGEYKDNLFDGMQATLETSAKATFNDNEQLSLQWTLQSLRQDDQLEEFVDAVPSVLLRDDKINFELTKVLGPPLEEAVQRLLKTCRGDILPEGARKQRLTACYRTIWCLEGLSLKHTNDLLDKWISPRRGSVKEEWDVLCFEAWKAAQQTATIKPNGRLELLAECSQTLLAMMWAMGRYSTTQDELDEARHILQDQLQYPPPVPGRTPLIPQPSSLTYAITIQFLRRALPVISGRVNAPDDIRLIFSKVAESFGEKALGIPEAVAYRNAVPPEFGEWRSQFITLISSLKTSENRSSLFPYATFRDIRELYHFSGSFLNGPGGSRSTNGSYPPLPFPCLQATGVWCCVKLIHAMLADIKALGSGGEMSRISGALLACWKIANMMKLEGTPDKDPKVIFRSYCIRAMLTVEWCEVTRHAATIPSGSRPDARSAHSEVSGRYVNNEEQDMQANPNFRLVAAKKLLEDLTGGQFIAELKDRNVADDFETTLRHLLGGRQLPDMDPQLDQSLEHQVMAGALPSGPDTDKDGLEDAFRKVRNFADRQGLARITSFINMLGVKAS